MSNLAKLLNRQTLTPTALLVPTRPTTLPGCLPLVGAERPRMVWVLVLAIASASCHKHTTPTSTSAEGQQAKSEASPSADRQVGVESGTSKPLDGYAHPFMSAQLRAFIAQNGRFPTNFAELAHTRLDVVPRTPPGMTWAIDRVTQEVKLVKK